VIYSYCRHELFFLILLWDSCMYAPKCQMCFRHSRLIKLTSALLNIKQYATPLQSILVILSGPKHQWTYKNFYGYTKQLYIARFKVFMVIDVRIQVLQDVMWCCVIGWVIPEYLFFFDCCNLKKLRHPNPSKTQGSTRSVIQHHIPEHFTKKF
jgi:hypothetical protein